MRTASMCPVRPPRTSSYVGLRIVPPVNPVVVNVTPSIRSNTACSVQKQPPARIAVSLVRCGAVAGNRALAGSCDGRVVFG